MTWGIDRISAFFLLAILALLPAANATTNCVQDQRLLGLTGEPAAIIWIAEDVAGECYYSQLLQVVLEETEVGLLRTYLREYGEWGAVVEAFGLLESELESEVAEQADGSWRIGKSTGEIHPPPDKPRLRDSFPEEAPWSAEGWNRRHGKDGIVLPVFEGMEVDLAYYHPDGFYVDYDVSQVHYFERAGIVVVFTRQELQGSGKDTMHGFLVFRIVPAQH
jgi:hypothetical protein